MPGKNIKLHPSPIQKDEHSMHNSIFLKKDGACFATMFLAGVKISERDHIALIPQETNKNIIRLLIWYYSYHFRGFKKKVYTNMVKCVKK